MLILTFRRAIQAIRPGTMMSERCKRCWRAVTPSYAVTDEVWQAVDRDGYRVLCLSCFGTLARRRLRGHWLNLRHHA